MEIVVSATTVIGTSSAYVTLLHCRQLHLQCRSQGNASKRCGRGGGERWGGVDDVPRLHPRLDGRHHLDSCYLCRLHRRWWNLLQVLETIEVLVLFFFPLSIITLSFQTCGSQVCMGIRGVRGVCLSAHD